MTIKQLEYFFEVAKTLNFSVAAKNLFISQPALSKSIAALEEELGAELFIRDRHNVVLTVAGVSLKSSYLRLKAELDKAVVLVHQSREGMRGLLSFGVQKNMRLPLAVSSAINYARLYMPYVELRLVSMEHKELVDAVAGSRVDIAYVCDASAESGAGLKTLAVNSSRVRLAVNPRYVDRHAPPENHNYVFVGGEGSIRARRWISHCKSKGFAPRISSVINTATQMLMIENGFGVGVLPEGYKVFEADDVDAVEIPDAYEVQGEVCWSAENTNPMIAVFTELINSEL